MLNLELAFLIPVRIAGSRSKKLPLDFFIAAIYAVFVIDAIYVEHAYLLC